MRLWGHQQRIQGIIDEATEQGIVKEVQPIIDDMDTLIGESLETPKVDYPQHGGK